MTKLLPRENLQHLSVLLGAGKPQGRKEEVKGRELEGKGREGKGREGKGRQDEGKGRGRTTRNSGGAWGASDSEPQTTV